MMKTKAMKITGILLTLVMMVNLLGVFSITVSAEATTYPLWVGGEQFTSEKLEISGTTGTATYDPNTNTLTLNNYTYSGSGYGNAAIYCYDEDDDNITLKLVLEGTNSVTHSGGELSFGVYVVGNVEISGSGSLTATGGNSTSGSYGIRVTGDITVSGGTLIATGGAASADLYASSNGIYALKITISGGSVTAIGGPATNSYSNESSYGVWANVAISGGEVIAQGEKKAFEYKPTVDASFTGAVVWYGESKDAADSAGAQAISDLTNNYNQKYVKVAAGAAAPVASVTTAENVTTEYSDIQFAINAAQASNGSTLKLLDDVTTSSLTLITSGSFTIDLNGKTWQSDIDVLAISGTETSITMTDTSIEGTGKLLGNKYVRAIDAGGRSFTMSGGTIEGDIGYTNGTIDLSSHRDPTGIRIVSMKEFGEDVSVSGTVILPAGYAMLDADGNNADTLVYGQNYTVGVASTVIKYPLWVGGEQFDAEKLTIIGGEGTASYDLSNNTLTLNNYIYSGAGYQDAAIYYRGSTPLKLVLVGNSSITHSGGENSHGLFAMGNVEISGTGSLTATGGAAYLSSYGVYASSAVTVSGGSLTATGGHSTYTGSYGVGADSITVTGGSLTAIGGNSASRRSYGVYASSDVIVLGGSLTATSGIASDKSYGLWTYNGVTMGDCIGIRIPEGGRVDTDGYDGNTVVDAQGNTANHVEICVCAHSWGYTANGDTLTKGCQAENCPGAEEKTIVISAVGKVYDGEAVTATITNHVDSTDYSTSIVYEAKTGSLTDGKAVNAGTYTAKITVDGVTASVDFTIEKVMPSYTAPTGLAATYGDTLADVALPEGFSWKDADAAVGNAGRNLHVAIFTPEDTDNYNTVECELEVTVEQRYVDFFSVSLEVTQYTYDGSAKTPAVKVVVDGVTLLEGVDFEVSYGKNVNAGKAFADVTFKGNYSGAENKDFWIIKGNPAYIIPTGLTATYGDTLADVELPEGFSWKDADAAVGNAGRNLHVAIFTPEDTDNYNTVEVEVTVAVQPMTVTEATVTLSQTEYEYDGTAKKPVVTSVVVDGKTLTEGVDYEIVGYVNNVNAGDATVTVKGIGNYSGTASKTFTIAPRVAELVWDNTTLEFNGERQAPTASVSNLLAGDECQVTVKGTGKYAGTFTAAIVALDNPNYVLPENATAEYTIWADSYKVMNNLIPESVKTAVSDAVSNAVEDAMAEIGTALRNAVEDALENAFNGFMEDLKGRISKVLG